MVAYLTTQSGGTLPNVKKVQIIADGSAQQFPYTTFLSEVRYAGQNLTKQVSPNSLGGVLVRAAGAPPRLLSPAAPEARRES